MERVFLKLFRRLADQFEETVSRAYRAIDTECCPDCDYVYYEAVAKCRSAGSRIRFTRNRGVCRCEPRQGWTFATGRLVAKRQRIQVCIVSVERPTARGRGSFGTGVR